MHVLTLAGGPDGRHVWLNVHDAVLCVRDGAAIDLGHACSDGWCVVMLHGGSLGEVPRCALIAL